MNDSDDPRLPRSDRDPDDVQTTAASNVDPGAGRALIDQHSRYLDELAAAIRGVPDTLIRAQLAQHVMDRFRPVRDDALHTLTITYDKPPKQVAKDVGCSVSDVVMACAKQRSQP